MGLEINRAFSVGALQPNTRVDRNRHNAYFGTKLNADTFQSTSVKYYVTEPSIRKAIGANPKIHAIVKDFNPEDYINPKDAKRMDRYTQFAMVAADEAIADAKLATTKVTIININDELSIV